MVPFQACAFVALSGSMARRRLCAVVESLKYHLRANSRLCGCNNNYFYYKQLFRVCVICVLFLSRARALSPSLSLSLSWLFLFSINFYFYIIQPRLLFQFRRKCARFALRSLYTLSLCRLPTTGAAYCWAFGLWRAHHTLHISVAICSAVWMSSEY